MNIFVCQTPFQLFYAEELIKRFTSLNGSKKKSLVFHSNLKGIDNNIEYFNLGNNQGMLTRFNKFKKAKKIIDKIIKHPNHKVNFFIPQYSYSGVCLVIVVLYNLQQHGIIKIRKQTV